MNGAQAAEKEQLPNLWPWQQQLPHLMSDMQCAPAAMNAVSRSRVPAKCSDDDNKKS